MSMLCDYKCMILILIRANSSCSFVFFFFNDTAPTEIYTLPLHDALPIFLVRGEREPAAIRAGQAYSISDVELASRLSFFLWSSIPDDELITLAAARRLGQPAVLEDRQSTRLNSSHSQISYAVFCSQKKTNPFRREILHQSRCTSRQSPRRLSRLIHWAAATPAAKSHCSNLQQSAPAPQLARVLCRR